MGPAQQGVLGHTCKLGSPASWNPSLVTLLLAPGRIGEGEARMWGPWACCAVAGPSLLPSLPSLVLSVTLELGAAPQPFPMPVLGPGSGSEDSR